LTDFKQDYLVQLASEVATPDQQSTSEWYSDSSQCWVYPARPYYQGNHVNSWYPNNAKWSQMS